jgi:hypothetical protein
MQHIKMLTGDAVAIAIETCKQLSLGTNVYDSERLIGGSMAGSDVRDFIEAADGFAEVFPEHKYQVDMTHCLDISRVNSHKLCLGRFYASGTRSPHSDDWRCMFFLFLLQLL